MDREFLSFWIPIRVNVDRIAAHFAVIDLLLEFAVLYVQSDRKFFEAKRTLYFDVHFFASL